MDKPVLFDEERMAYKRTKRTEIREFFAVNKMSTMKQSNSTIQRIIRVLSEHL